MSRAGLLAGVSSVWLTPLIKKDEVFRALTRQRHPTLVVAGTGDPATPPEVLTDLERHLDSAVAVMRIADGDHALERPDPNDAVAALAEVVSALARLVGTTAPRRQST